jgi:hypothetical protein
MLAETLLSLSSARRAEAEKKRPLLLAERGKAPTALDLNNDLESIMTTFNLFHSGKGEKKNVN